MFNFVANYRKYGDVPNSWDILKAFAIVTMVVDHVGAYLFPDALWLRAIGRLSFPVWLFLAGYAARSDNIASRELLGIAVLLIVVDFVFGMGIFPVNILVTIIICRLFIRDIRGRDRDWISFSIYCFVFISLLQASSLVFDYGTLALLFALSGFYHREYGRDRLSTASVFICGVTFVVSQYYNFGFDLYQALFVSVGTVCLCWVLHNFEPGEKGTGVSFVDNLVMFLGRNSLYIYFIHIVILSWVAWWCAGGDYSDLFRLRLFP